MISKTETLYFDSPVLLAGPADMDFNLLENLIGRQYPVIAADGGANQLLDRGIIPEAIIGDMDSLDALRKIPPQTKLIQHMEQGSCDFEKCLYSVQAPLFLAFGFTGGRFDHTLAVLHGMVKYYDCKHVLLLGKDDISFIHSGMFSIPSDPGQTLSIFPLRPISFSGSNGLEFSLEGLEFDIGRKIGTSNFSNSERIQIFPFPECQNTPYVISLSKTTRVLENLLEYHML